ISRKAVERIREIGANGIHGTISSTPDTGYSTVFLSYFVDRDCDQRATFEKTGKILQSGGHCILEGLFPCVLKDSNGVSYGTANVTRGINAMEDIELVVAEFAQLGISLGRTIISERLVYSMDGPEVLPSFILIFKKI
ncbi:MAG: hypothetical protein WCI76_01765, partial [bacterium]